MDEQLIPRETIIKALRALDEELGSHEVKAQIYLVGGAVMCLVHKARPATKDVDGWFTEPQILRSAAKKIADYLNLPSDWLNDAAKGFLPRNAEFEEWNFWPNLEVLVANPRTLLAMKCLAARGPVDRDDIVTLARILGLKSSAEVLDVVLHFFPAEQLPMRSQLLVEELFDADSQESD